MLDTNPPTKDLKSRRSCSVFPSLQSIRSFEFEAPWRSAAKGLVANPCCASARIDETNPLRLSLDERFDIGVW
jgi:hypothetical protein